MDIKKITDQEFIPYGRLLRPDFDYSELLEKMEKIPVTDEVVYVASEVLFEGTECAEKIKDSVYGGMPIQIGYCNGRNQKLNALEYHRDSEVVIACTDLIFLVGKQQDINPDFTYNTERVEAFLVKKGQMVETYATTLHYAPCHSETGNFKSIVILPKGTNGELSVKTSNTSEDRLLMAVNKWLIAHEEAQIDRAFNGLIGENIQL